LAFIFANHAAPVSFHYFEICYYPPFFVFFNLREKQQTETTRRPLSQFNIIIKLKQCGFDVSKIKAFRGFVKPDIYFEIFKKRRSTVL
jgi:hypothetical protein